LCKIREKGVIGLFDGRLLKELREQRGLRQEDLAVIFNTTQQNISYYESGDRQPNNETIVLMSNYFGVSADRLLGKPESMSDLEQKYPNTVQILRRNNISPKDDKKIAKIIEAAVEDIE
jgi:transcriptional regulator with XRE-family HTH domain